MRCHRETWPQSKAAMGRHSNAAQRLSSSNTVYTGKSKSVKTTAKVFALTPANTSTPNTPTTTIMLMIAATHTSTSTTTTTNAITATTATTTMITQAAKDTTIVTNWISQYSVVVGITAACVFLLLLITLMVTSCYCILKSSPVQKGVPSVPSSSS